eukprot:4472550-Amphidinium_carterae.1
MQISAAVTEALKEKERRESIVASSATGVSHRVALGSLLAFAPVDWSIVCVWRFGFARRGTRRVAVPGNPLYSKCFNAPGQVGDCGAMA